MDMKRVGNFHVTDNVVFGNEEVMTAYQKLIGEVFICSALHNFGYGRFEYIGFSEHFREVEEGECAPTYRISIDKNGARFEELL